MKARLTQAMIFCFALIFQLGCERPFSYSPFEITIDPARRNTNQKNLDRIARIDTGTLRSFRIALFSDPHFHFEELKAAVEHINRRNDVKFIVVLGDITENGLQKEFEIFHEIMSHARQPYLTVIGNHDHLANGGEVYEQMYGALNYSFSFQGVKFIAFDNVLWENPSPIDYAWLESELKTTYEELAKQPGTNQVIMMSHIPPFDRQLAEKRDYFHSLLKGHGVQLSLHGHKHVFDIGEWSGEEVLYCTVGSPQHHGYVLLDISEDQFTVSKVDF